MEVSQTFINGQRAVLMCVASIVLCAGIVASTVAADGPARTDAAVKKMEPPKQSGSFLIKFEASAGDAKIDEVAEYYGANKVLALSNSESSTHKDPERWRKLRFDAVDDVKDIARRIFQDMRVDEVDEVVWVVNQPTEANQK